ncbi:hypothetical protein PROFUN_02972 [Planoprotostelium fungivorum]|uniref:UDENN domain-containing protein n=1 Tax=Planoprotostelium fungivorum TaxID=1890364 RepID=A0A2P6NX80_9EUKA|nr:hypothetical protein PROFUN_02972 [Planoprotostelium fungivorum]
MLLWWSTTKPALAHGELSSRGQKSKWIQNLSIRGYANYFVGLSPNSDIQTKPKGEGGVAPPQSPEFTIKKEDVLALRESPRSSRARNSTSNSLRPGQPLRHSADGEEGRRRSMSGNLGGGMTPERRRELFLRDNEKSSKSSWIEVDTDDSGRPLKPEILFKFPPDKDIPFEAVPFCFPQKATIHKVLRRGSFSEVHNAIFGSMRLLEKTKNFFLFLLVQDTEVFYGVCVKNQELLKRWPSFSQSDVNKDNLRSLSDYGSFTTRVYCFISRFPFFKLHYEVIFSILARERLYVFEEQKDGLETLLRQSRPNLMIDLEQELQKQAARVDEVPNEITALLQSYYGKIVPRSGQSLEFELPQEVHSLLFTCPEEDEDILLATWCLPVLFSAVKVESVLTLLSAVLQERSIIIECSNCGVLSAVVLSIIPLLRPYVWQGPIIPILPANMMEFLQSPVPYIVGVSELPDSLASELCDATILRINKTDDVITQPVPEKLPSLPHYEKLYLLFSIYNPPFLDLPHSLKPQAKKEDVDAFVRIVYEFRQYHSSLLDPIRPHMKPGILQLMDKSKLVHSIPKRFRDFFQRLIETQQFAEFLQHVTLLQFEDEKPTQMVLAEVEDRIQQLEKQKREAFERIRECDEQIAHLRKQQSNLLMGPILTKAPGLVRTSIEFLSRSYNEKFPKGLLHSSSKENREKK